jgi:ABC-2 type transport system permease protein
MNPRHIATLFIKELKGSFGNFFLVFAVIVPLVMSFVVSVVFGTLFSEQAKLGVYGEGGDSALLGDIIGLEFLDTTRYDSQAELEDAVRDGAVDVGVVLPRQVDTRLASNETVEFDFLVWGESQAKNRATATAAVNEVVFERTAQHSLVTLNTVEVGEDDDTPLEDRLLPLILMMAVVMGGTLLPAASLVDEKQKRTLVAVASTPASLWDIYTAKALLGVLLSVVMGIVVLVINAAFGQQPALIITILFLGALMSAAFGILMAAFIRDMNSLFALMKTIGIALYAPAFILLFPDQIPQWIAQVFPTYYIVGPINDITLHGAGWNDVLPELGALLVFTGLLMGLVAYFGTPEKQIGT